MTSNEQVNMRVAESIFKNVLAAMQGAEEMGGPEGAAYVILMSRIATEANERIRQALESGTIIAKNS